VGFVKHVNLLRKILVGGRGVVNNRKKKGKEAIFQLKQIGSSVPTPKLDSALMMLKLISDWLR